MNISDNTGNNNPLGQKVEYIDNYQPDLLFAISRQDKRDEIGYLHTSGLSGADIWNAYELSWLNQSGLPQVAIGQIIIPATSPNLIESKSLKLYFNSFNQSKFTGWEEVKNTISKDLTHCAGESVSVDLFAVYSDIHNINSIPEQDGYPAICIDEQLVEIDIYDYSPDFLITDSNQNKSETLCSHLLKSNCLITHQPDWGSVYIRYSGKSIEKEGLLKYIVSFRNHNEFHEQCVERIFNDIMHYCQPDKLTVYARYTRRGGLDINPWRSNFEQNMANFRLSRQ
ncbi:MAG: NADPH-dependent 7-cyano-7-deazaguanine reductase QueF [Gammaproteobacteria bacterium]|nr:NADPH-dependent 7-cyano-7-deazaguanine reductase QueF [Gammaproteobacteria bacterium]